MKSSERQMVVRVDMAKSSEVRVGRARLVRRRVSVGAARRAGSRVAASKTGTRNPDTDVAPIRAAQLVIAVRAGYSLSARVRRTMQP
jgi:hypothetical protein